MKQADQAWISLVQSIRQGHRHSAGIHPPEEVLNRLYL